MIPSTPDVTPPHLSYSSVSSYSDCSEKFRLLKVVQVKRRPSWAAMAGSAVHEATATLDLLDFGVNSDGPKNFSEGLDREIAKAEGSGYPKEEWHRSGRASKAYPNKEDEAWWREHGQGFVDGWRQWLGRSGFGIYVHADLGPSVEISYTVNIGGYPAKGYIDRVLQAPDGSLGVVDLKSGREPVSSDQLRDYGIALSRLGEEMTPFPRPSWGSYYMAREGGCTPPIQMGSADDKYRDQVYAVTLAGIRSGIFLPNRSRFCDSCDVARFCIAMGREAA